VPLATGNNPVAGTLAATTTAAALGNRACVAVLIQADPANGASLLLGDADAQPIVLAAGDSLSLPVTNVNQVYAKMASGTGTVNWLALL
jgi:hypothetical protein